MDSWEYSQHNVNMNCIYFVKMNITMSKTDSFMRTILIIIIISQVFYHTDFVLMKKIMRFYLALLVFSYFYNCTVKSFRAFINKLIEFFQWIIVSMIPFIANAVFICWFAIFCILNYIDQGNQLLIINTIDIITIMQPSNLNVFLHGYFL